MGNKIVKKKMSSFELECLEAHNKCRAKHGCAPLQLDRKLCAYANEWAQHLARTHSFQHRSNNKYGENLFMAAGKEVRGADAVDAWYGEISNYRYNRPVFGMGTGHFTQVVWSSSKHLGVAYAKSGNATYVVANYDPPGNCMGKFAENVPPPRM